MAVRPSVLAESRDPSRGTVAAALYAGTTGTAAVVWMIWSLPLAGVVWLVGIVIAYALSRKLKERVITVFSDGTLRVRYGESTSDNHCDQIIRMDDTGDFRPGARVFMEFRDGSEVANLDYSESRPVILAVVRLLDSSGRGEVVATRVRRALKE